MKSPLAGFVAVPALVLALAHPVGAQAAKPPAGAPATPPAATAPAQAQAGKLTLAELQKMAEAQIAIAVVLDSSGAQLAQVKNKTLQAQAEMQQKRLGLVSEALSKRGLTVDEYDRRRLLVSSDARLRFQLDSIVAKMTGQPVPGTLVAAAPAAPAVTLPPNLIGIALGYVAVGYLDTPDKSGLIAMAQTEAKVAAQHAGFMMRALDNLQTMQMHAGHVLHAIDPTTMPDAKAPGKNYGVKRALDGVVAYVDYAAKSPTASTNVKTHSVHILAAARSTSTRADQVIAMARKIQSATTPQAAAALVGQLQSLCDQLLAGSDLNHDGRIVWGDGEGGLQQAQEHMGLLIKGEAAAPKP